MAGTSPLPDPDPDLLARLRAPVFTALSTGTPEGVQVAVEWLVEMTGQNA